MQPKLCLNMIVKSEMANLPRLFESVAPHITAAVIFDTGSTDGTQDYCWKFFRERGINVWVDEGPFIDFAQARNEALSRAQMIQDVDYILFADADMELVAEGPLPPLTKETYTLLQRQGGMAYHNTRLLRHGSAARYWGVTHEFIGSDDHAKLPGDVWWFRDHATGSNRGDKFERDTRLLEGYLKEHPNDARTLFYLANTYRDRGMHEEAAKLYAKRIEVGGWEEEVWYSRMQLAYCFRNLGQEDRYIASMLEAYNARPIRAETIYSLARHYREKKDQQHVAMLFAQSGSKIKMPGDVLFVEQWQYDWGFDEEKSILGAYKSDTFDEGLNACDRMALDLEVPPFHREGARKNLFWYLRPLGHYCPDFKTYRIPEVNPDSKYVNSNPSVAVHDGKVHAIVRTVSYRIRPDGTYDYNGTPAIRTTNYFADFDKDLQLTKAVKLLRPTGFPEPVFKDILDVEDMRLFRMQGEWWANGCVLEQNHHAWREQFLMKLNPETGEVTDWSRIEPMPKNHEKNWMPFVHGSGHLRFMYRSGVVIDRFGNFLTTHPPLKATDQFSGGGQLIRFDSGWLGIIHEARPDPTNGKRYYQHRFCWYNYNYELKEISKPFVFFDRQIEFAAGLARDELNNNIIISFGVLDREAWLATVPEQQVWTMLWGR